MKALVAVLQMAVAGCAGLLLIGVASATPVRIAFHGTAGSGYADLTLAPDPNSSSNYQPTYNAVDGANHISPPLSPYDPAGAEYIAGASGNFNGVAITGVKPLDQGESAPGEVLPASFSWIYTLTGTTAGANSYDNLFYAAGSPLVCPPVSAGGGVGYPFSGGFLDIYGLMFELSDGGFVGLWSDGVLPGGLTYGLDVFVPNADGSVALQSSQFSGVYAAVPEPRFMWLFGAALLGFFMWRRFVEARKSA